MQVALAMRAVELNGWYKADYDLDEARLGIMWTLFMLDSVIGSGSRSSLKSSAMHRLPVYQGGPTWPPAPTEFDKAFSLDVPISSRPDTPCKSVVAVIIELLDVWSSITSHLLSDQESAKANFWQHSSPRAELMGRLTELELSGWPVTAYSGIDA
jgi:hypothetical protein